MISAGESKAPKVARKHESAPGSTNRLATTKTKQNKQQKIQKMKTERSQEEEEAEWLRECEEAYRAGQEGLWQTQADASVEPSSESEVTTSFVDVANTIVDVESGEMPALARADDVSEGELAQFLSRPIRISNLSWAESDTVGIKTTIDPWTLYLNTAIIKKKLDNYTWFRGNLHLKFVINASPFYYGLMMASYKPLPNWAAADAGSSSSFNSVVLRSQRPHVMMLPAASLGGEMTVPFIFPANYVGIQSAADVAEMGRVTFDIISVLASANGVTGQAVSIQTFAWMEDVTLQGPTVGVALQSGYSKTGAVSSLASAAAGVANKFSTLPFVGKFMKATAVGANAIGDIASMFGFTNVPVLEAARPMRPVPFPPLASTEIGYPTEKLTLDPKNELAIDGAPLGLQLDDDLQISNIVQREAILTKATWSTSTLVDAQLFRSAVTPQLFAQDTATTVYSNYLTPMCWAASLFREWRGDVIFRFDFIASKYHRGRVVVSWEPNAVSGSNVSTTPNTMGTVITKVLDLGAETSMELRVPYAQAYPWLKNYIPNPIQNVYTVNGSDVNQANYGAGFHNGLLVMRVLNVLTAPVGTSSIDVVVSVRGAENLEFANPVSPPQWSQWTTQSKRVFETPVEADTIGEAQGESPERFAVNMGECVRSLRQVLRRSYLNEVWEVASDTTNQLAIVSHTQTRFPLTYGYDPAGFWTGKGLITTASSFPFNYTLNTPYNWLAPAFAGVRGSMMWHYNFYNQSTGTFAQHPVKVTRTATASQAGGGTARQYFSQATKTGTNDAYFYMKNLESSGGGLALTNTITNSGVSVSLPNYSQSLMQSTDAATAITPQRSVLATSSDEDFATLEVLLHPAQGQTTRCATIEKYCAAGTDLSLNFFINVPVWYQYRGAVAP